MPIESHIDAERRLVIARVVGDFTLFDILETIDRSVCDPEFRPGFDILSDHTQVGEPLTTSQAIDMVEHMESLADKLGGGRWAVVTSKPASYGMMRMVSVLAQSVPLEVQVFESHAEAEAWLSSPKAKRR